MPGAAALMLQADKADRILGARAIAALPPSPTSVKIGTGRRKQLVGRSCRPFLFLGAGRALPTHEPILEATAAVVARGGLEMCEHQLQRHKPVTGDAAFAEAGAPPLRDRWWAPVVGYWLATYRPMRTLMMMSTATQVMAVPPGIGHGCWPSTRQPHRNEPQRSGVGLL